MVNQHLPGTAVLFLALQFPLSVGWLLAEEDTSAPNLAAHPSFEQPGNTMSLPDGWSGPPSVYTIDKEERRVGQASLKYVNNDAKRYALCSQRVPLRPGWKYRFSVWAKTENLSGSESGATICLEWQDKQGKWLGGVYPTGVKGTRDWTRIEGVTRIPEEAGSCTLLCYVRQGMTGTAWFDDVELVRIVDPPMWTMLVSPVYRGRITADGPDEGTVQVRFDLTDYEWTPKDLRVEACLRRESNDQAIWQTVTQPAENQLDVTFPTQELEPGTYDLVVSVRAFDGETLQTTHHRLTRVPDEFSPRVTIDRHYRTLVAGEPFFPLGMYWSGINDKDIRLYADSKFNCLMPYGSPNKDQMELAQRYGLKVIYSIKDWYTGSRFCPNYIKTKADEEIAVRQRVQEFRDHPALLAWYLNDELPLSFMPQLEAHQRWVVDEDPHHPTWVVLYQYQQVADYRNTFDVIGTDPYPIGRAPASQAAAWTAETLRQVLGARPIWQVPQAHNWINYRKDDNDTRQYHTPTFDEERSMAWQCICEGATGLVFYSWYDIKRNPDVPFEVQWSHLKKIAAEIDRLSPMILSAEPAPEVHVNCESATTGNPGWLHWLARSYHGKLYVFTVNDGDGAGFVDVTLSAVPRMIRVLGEDRPVRARGTSFRDHFEKLAVRVYEIEP